MSTYEAILYAAADGVATITLNRPAVHNAMNEAMRRDLMAATCVRLARGERVDIADPYDSVEDYYMARDLDTLPGIFHADALFDGVEEAAEQGSTD